MIDNSIARNQQPVSAHNRNRASQTDFKMKDIDIIPKKEALKYEI